MGGQIPGAPGIPQGITKFITIVCVCVSVFETACLVNTRHIQKHGLTAHRILNGQECTARHWIFGECCLFKVAEIRMQGKLLPRWKRGIWVGTRDSDQSHILLDETGWNSAREVSRFPVESRWCTELMQKCAGLPWSKHDGAANAAMDVLSELHVWLPVTVGSQIAIGVDIEGVLETSFLWPRTLSPLQSPGFAMFGNVTAVTLSATDSPGYWMS